MRRQDLRKTWWLGRRSEVVLVLSHHTLICWLSPPLFHLSEHVPAAAIIPSDSESEAEKPGYTKKGKVCISGLSSFIRFNHCWIPCRLKTQNAQHLTLNPKRRNQYPERRARYVSAVYHLSLTLTTNEFLVDSKHKTRSIWLWRRIQCAWSWQVWRWQRIIWQWRRPTQGWKTKWTVLNGSSE